MNDQEFNRLKKFIVFSWCLLLAVLVGLAVWGSVALKNLRYQLATVQTTPGPQGLQGPSGIQGQNGVGSTGSQGSKGDKGDTGNTGSGGSNGTVGPAGPQGEAGPQGPQGTPGEQGPPGKTVFLRYNPITGQEECRYAGDTDWQPASECK